MALPSRPLRVLVCRSSRKHTTLNRRLTRSMPHAWSWPTTKSILLAETSILRELIVSKRITREPRDYQTAGVTRSRRSSSSPNA